MSLLVDSDLEKRFNVQNFVIYNKKKFTPVMDIDIKKLNDLGKSVDILAHPTLFSNALNSFHYKNDVLFYHNDRVEILDDIKANIQIHEEDIKDLNLRRLLKLNVSNNDYSNIIVNAEDKIIELNYNDNKDNPLKVPEADKSCIFFINSNEVGDTDIDVLNRHIPLPSVENFRKIINEDKKKISLSFNTYRHLENILNKLNFRNNPSYKRLSNGFTDKLTTVLAEKT